jgi:putative addiction module antidote
MELKITKIGNSLGIVLPKEITAQMNLDKGDSVFATKTPNGYALTSYDDAFANQMTLARDIMKKYRNVLHELAK